MTLSKILTRSIPVSALILIWEASSRGGVIDALLFPPPSIVLHALYEWALTGELHGDVMASCARALAGFLIGSFFGVVIGIATGRHSGWDRSVTPIIQVLRPLPPVAIIPLVIVWLGIDDLAKIFSISFAVFFPVWVSAHMGSKSIAQSHIWSAQLLSKSKFKVAWKVLLPGAFPSILTGLRTAIATSFIMVYVSEIAGASSGIGYQISVSHLAYRIDKMMAALLVLGVIGLLTDQLFTRFLYWRFPWLRLQND